MDRVLGIILLVLIVLAGWIFIYEAKQHALLDTDPETELRSLDDAEEAAMLPDFAQIADVKEKKQAFFDYLLPAVEQANSIIMQERNWLLALDLQTLTDDDRRLLTDLADKYQQPRKDKQSLADWHKALLKKVDIIPPSLALAQAANESAWGTSRFAIDAFNLYGQWCFSPGCGLVPTGRPAGKTYEVRLFVSPQASVEAYMLNLNAFHSYREMRQIRLKLRENKKPLLGTALARGLIAYSQRREAYVKEIKSMIRFNQLEQLDLQAANTNYAFNQD